VLKNKFFTIIFVPFSEAIFQNSQPSHQIDSKKDQNSDLFFFDIILKFDTDEILERASHLNPKVIILYKSSSVLIFEVVYFSRTIFKSSLSIHSQLSVIIISSIPQFSTSTFTIVAQASIEFSTNSFTTDKGLSTTSQAAI